MLADCKTVLHVTKCTFFENKEKQEAARRKCISEIDRIAAARFVGSQNERKIDIVFLYENINDTKILLRGFIYIFSVFTSIKSYPADRKK